MFLTDFTMTSALLGDCPSIIVTPTGGHTGLVTKPCC